MSIPLQFASLYDFQEVFVSSDCLLDLGTDFLVGNGVFVRGYLHDTKVGENINGHVTPLGD